jgi:DNA-directed RNA polymerase specialized sigma24 family protein
LGVANFFVSKRKEQQMKLDFNKTNGSSPPSEIYRQQQDSTSTEACKTEFPQFSPFQPPKNNECRSHERSQNTSGPVKRAREHRHGPPRTFTFSDGSVIRLCVNPQCEAFDEERRAVLRTNSRKKPATATDNSDPITTLYHPHNPLVRAQVWRYLRSKDGHYPPNAAEILNELVNEIWGKITAAYPNYQNRGYKVTTWIGTIAKNHVLDWRAKIENRRRLAPAESLDAHPSPDKDRRISDSKLPARSTPVAQNPDQVLDLRVRYGSFALSWGASGD